MTPGLFYFNKINQLIEQAGQKAVTHVLPLARFNMLGVSGKSMSATHPTVVDIVFDIIEFPYWPGDKILNVIQCVLGQPVSEVVLDFCRGVPGVPLFRGARTDFFGAANPICESSATPVI